MRYYLSKKKTGEVMIKTKIVLFKYFIALHFNITIHGKLVKTFLDIQRLSFRILELTFL